MNGYGDRMWIRVESTHRSVYKLHHRLVFLPKIPKLEHQQHQSQHRQHHHTHYYHINQRLCRQHEYLYRPSNIYTKCTSMTRLPARTLLADCLGLLETMSSCYRIRLMWSFIRSCLIGPAHSMRRVSGGHCRLFGLFVAGRWFCSRRPHCWPSRNWRQ